MAQLSFILFLIFQKSKHIFTKTKKLTESITSLGIGNVFHLYSQYVQPNLIPKKFLQQKFDYFSISKYKERSWGNFEGMFPELFLWYWPKWPERPNSLLSILLLCLKGVFKGQYLKNTSGNILSKFYQGLFLTRIIKKWVYWVCRSFFIGIVFVSIYWALIHSFRNHFHSLPLWWVLTILEPTA